MPGFLDHDRVRDVLAAADVWVLPSYTESFGIAVVEALAAGVPVVTTDRVNIWPLLRRAGAGVVTRPEVDSFVAGVIELASRSPSERHAMGQRGRDLCVREFTWGSVAEKLEHMYLSIRRQGTD
jgi:glycosyltransferase involved in cell wall biosynthesis